MKTTSNIAESISSTEVSKNAVPMSIDSESRIFLMDMLGKLYRRPAQAVLREYLSNALDAHASKGGNLPAIQVSLPQKGDKKPILTIRDFGKGMSEEEFSTILSRYGKSTKRDSNDLIGGFGLGAKSGFALGDEFFMTSYQSGQGLRVRLFKDNQNQGYVEVVERFQTREPDGMLVEVKIPRSNVGELYRSSLNTFFMAYPTGAVDVSPKNAVGASLHDSHLFSPIELNGKVLGWIGNETKDSSSYNTLYIIIGNVVYDVNLSEMREKIEVEKSEFSTWFDFLWYSNRMKAINVPIGTVDMPSSREEITLSPKSVTTINGVLSTYVSLLHAHFQKEINKLTYREALAYVTALEASQIPDVSFQWRGKLLGKKLIEASSAYIMELNYDSRRKKTSYAVKSIPSSVEFCGLLEKAHNVFIIPVENDYYVPSVRNKLSEGTLSVALTTLNRQDALYNSIFIVMPKGDALDEMFADEDKVEVSVINEAIQKVAISNAKARALKQEKERAKKAVIANRLTSFILDTSQNDRYPNSYEPDLLFRIAKGKVYYWSQEEIFNIGLTVSDVTPVFPFKWDRTPNSYNIIPYPDSTHNWAFEYQHRLLAFLRLFMPKDTRIIILGQGASLANFKSSYPEVESGVQLVSEALVRQLADTDSDLNRVRSVCSAGLDRTTANFRRIVTFYGKLSETQRAKLPQEFSSFAEQVYATTKWTGLWPYFKEDYFNSVISIFCSDIPPVIKKDFEVDEEMMKKKYPILFGMPTSSLTKEVMNDLVEYVAMKNLK